MSEHDESVTVVVRNRDDWHVGHSVGENTALTLIGVVSEDPESWEDMAICWARYRTPLVAEFLDGLPIRIRSEDVARDAIDATDAWVFVDLSQKRLLTGPAYPEIGRREVFAMQVDLDGTTHYPVMVNLAPWWKLHEQVGADAIDRPRESTIRRPVTDREVLYGNPLLGHIAGRTLETVQGDRWAERNGQDERSNYPVTVEVHRDWLMTPRDELDGEIPREMLHGGTDWIDGLVHGQRIRCDDGGKIVAMPTDKEGFGTDPMGREEVVIYFELCRELISSAWSWCEANNAGQRLENGEDCTDELIESLKERKAEWMKSPYEGGAPPEFIIECSRRRVPHGANVPITGMSERQPEEEIIDPDCPLCRMMGEDGFGVCFTGFDGHQLELDGEFAFSLCETREEWEEQQREFEEITASIERELRERETEGEPGPDEPEPTWSGQISDEPIPGDEQGHLKMAFLLTEIVSMLQSKDIDSEVLGKLNDRFTAFRNCRLEELHRVGRRLGDYLESLTDRYPEITSRVADFCSRIDEHICMARSDEDATDVPF